MWKWALRQLCQNAGPFLKIWIIILLETWSSFLKELTYKLVKLRPRHWQWAKAEVGEISRLNKEATPNLLSFNAKHINSKELVYFFNEKFNWNEKAFWNCCVACNGDLDETEVRHDVIEKRSIFEVNNSVLVPNDAPEDAGADEDEAELPHHGEVLEPIPFVISGKNVVNFCYIFHSTSLNWKF